MDLLEAQFGKQTGSLMLLSKLDQGRGRGCVCLREDTGGQESVQTDI